MVKSIPYLLDYRRPYKYQVRRFRANARSPLKQAPLYSLETVFKERLHA